MITARVSNLHILKSNEDFACEQVRKTFKLSQAAITRLGLKNEFLVSYKPPEKPKKKWVLFKNRKSVPKKVVPKRSVKK